MAEKSLKKQTVSGIFWRIFETGGTQLIQFVISIVLARLIMPEQFALISMLEIFIGIANVFINSGFSAALIRKNNRTDIDNCTVFYFNIVVSFVCYWILFFIAPWVARFYNLTELSIILRINSIGIIIGSFAAVQRTLYQAELRFKELAKFNLTALIISGCVGMYLAFKGWQVWALVAQSLLNNFISTVYMWYKSYWRPSLQFSVKVLKEFFSFGSKLLASSLLDSVYSNMYSVVIGKFFPKADLAFYTRAGGLQRLTSSVPTGVLQSVTFPALCKMQESDEKLRTGYRNMIKVSAFVIFPLCLGIGAVSYPLINVFYTKVWIFSAALLQIIVFAGMWYPIHALNLNLLQVKGRSDLFFRLEVIKKILGVTVLCITLPMGLIPMCYGNVVTSILCLVINTHYTGKLLNLGFWTQMKDIFPSLLLSIIMFAACKALSTYMGDGVVSLLASVITGIAIYAGGAKLFRMNELHLLLNLRK